MIILRDIQKKYPAVQTPNSSCLESETPSRNRVALIGYGGIVQYELVIPGFALGTEVKPKWRE
jgi:hypothetical protein